MASSTHVPENLRSDILIPNSAHPDSYYLGPMGDVDPTEFINLETMRIPFKTSHMNLADWNGSFRNWPSKTPGWRDWWRRVSANNHAFWEEKGIDQCITLSLSEMEKNEPMLISACYFWSDALNAFMFANGPMTITLADVLKITGLKISGVYCPFDLTDKASHRIETKNIGGWAGYIAMNKRTGTVDHREHTAFLNMWLEKFVFCGTTIGPTSNHQKLAENLVDGKIIPLGKFLLGAAYSLLHQVRVKLSANQPIGTIGGPWWLIQMWINLYMHKAIDVDFTQLSFPSDYAEDEEEKTRRCMSYGELASAIPGSPSEPICVTNFFDSFYYGCNKDNTVWFLYNDEDNYELPLFRFSEALTEYKEDLHTMLTPTILPIGFNSGRSRQQSYEFYHPSVAARQLGCGQLPIGLHFSDKLKPRERINCGLDYNRIMIHTARFAPISIKEWSYGPICSKLFTRWWTEWKKHLFCMSSRTFCERLFADYIDDDEDIEVAVPTQSSTGRPIQYAPPSANPYIGASAPSVTDISKGKTLDTADAGTRKASSAPKQTKKPTKKRARQAAPSPQTSIESFRRERRSKKVHDPSPSESSERTVVHITRGEADAPDNIQNSEHEADNIGRNASNAPSHNSNQRANRSPEESSAARPRRTFEEERALKQFFDVPADSIFPFNANDYLSAEEVTSRALASDPSPHTLADEVKTKLEAILGHLNKDITTLVQNADPVRCLFLGIKNQLSSELASAIAPVAYIEAHEVPVLQAQKRISDRLAQEATRGHLDAGRQEAIILKERLDACGKTPTKLNQEIQQLEARKTQLAKELEEVQSALDDRRNQLQQLPTTMADLKQNLAQKIRDTRAIAKSIGTIPSTTEADNRIIKDVDQIRQRASDAIQNALGLV